MERELAWDGWMGNVDDAAVSSAGTQTLAWAVSVIREFLGEHWLADNAAQSGHVPLLSYQWWPLANSRAVVSILELATQIALVTSNCVGPELLREAKTIYANQDQVATKFQHLCLTLEVAAFAVTSGWSVSYEEPGSAGRRPDLTVRRHRNIYSLEATVLGLDREFRRIDRYCDKLHHLLGGLNLLIAVGPPRHAIADGPVAMSRILPGGRKRLTFVLPSPYPHLILPAGAGLEPGLWYHQEPSWLTQVLQSLGHPSLNCIIRTSRKT